MNMETGVLPDIRLRLRIEHPDLDECYLDGYSAAEAGFAEDNNPFAGESLEFAAWQEGWWAGFYGEDSLYEEDGQSTSPEAPAEDIAPGGSAANESEFWGGSGIVGTVLKYTGEIVALAVLGYQVIDLVA